MMSSQTTTERQFSWHAYLKSLRHLICIDVEIEGLLLLLHLHLADYMIPARSPSLQLRSRGGEGDGRRHEGEGQEGEDLHGEQGERGVSASCQLMLVGMRRQ
jgi:hypothetical protein